MEFAENFSCFSTEISDKSEKFRDTQFSQEDNIFHIKKKQRIAASAGTIIATRSFNRAFHLRFDYVNFRKFKKFLKSG